MGDAGAKIDTNLQGQRLGRKGRTTRDRIIAAARDVIENPNSEEFSVSAVARRADLRVSSIYNYFSDLTELFMTVLEPVIDEAQAKHLEILESYWPDEELELKCSQFMEAFHEFWENNVRLLHLRNNLAQQHNPRVLFHRISSARRIVARLALQMGAPNDENWGDEHDLASVLFAGLERVVTIITDELLDAPYPPNLERRFGKGSLKQQARLLALAIREARSARTAS